MVTVQQNRSFLQWSGSRRSRKNRQLVIRVRKSWRNIYVGAKFGRLKVLGSQFSVCMSRGTVWFVVAKCKCGTVKVVECFNLWNENTISCGCYRDDMSSPTKTHGCSWTRPYRIWRCMLNRCTNRNCHEYHRYGGRGIAVCKSWMKFENFRRWYLANGYADHLTLDRKNNDRGYSPGNCRWVTWVVNGRNKSNLVMIEAFGQRKCIMEWTEDKRCVVRYACLRTRLRNGWNAEVAMTTPSGFRPIAAT